MTSNLKKKNLLFPAVAGAVAIIGFADTLINEINAAASPSTMSEIHRGTADTSLIMQSDVNPTSSLTANNLGANDTNVTYVYSAGDTTTALTFTAGSVSACTTPLKSINLWLSAEGTSLTSQTLIFGANTVMPGTTVSIFDSSGGSASTTLNFTALSQSLGALSASNQIKLAPKDTVIKYYGPTKPTAFSTAGIAGVTFQYKEMAYIDVADVFSKKLK